MNKRNEKIQNTSLSGIGYRVSGIGYRVSGIEPNYIITTIRLRSTTQLLNFNKIFIFSQFGKTRGFCVCGDTRFFIDRLSGLTKFVRRIV